MFIRKQVINGHIYYSVVESIRPRGRRDTIRIIAPLGHEKNLGKAYQKELRAYLKAADRLARMERALAVMGLGAEYRGQ